MVQTHLCSQFHPPFPRQDSLRARKGCVRGMHALDQMEFMSMISATSLDDMLLIKRRHFGGSNQGNKLGDMHLPKLEDLWRTTSEERAAILGSSLKPVGGATVGLTPGRGSKPSPKDLEPVFHHTMDPKFYCELVHSYCLKRFLNLSATDGLLEMQMLELKVPTVSVCLNDNHKKALKDRIEVLMLKAMLDAQNSSFHEPSFAALFKAPEKKHPPALKPNEKKPQPGSAKDPPKDPSPKDPPKSSASLMEDFQKRLEDIKKNATGAEPPEAPDSPEQ